MRSLRYLLPVLLLIIAAATILWFRGRAVDSQDVPYQRIAAGLRAGKTIHLVETTYERRRVFATNPTPPPHALPESYTSELWLTYAGETVAMQCALVRDTSGAILQRTRYEPATGDLVTTFADGTTDRTPGHPYTLTQAIKGNASVPGISVPPGSTTTTEQQLSPSVRRVNHYDSVTGEYTGGEKWDDSNPAAPLLLQQVSQSMEVLGTSPCGGAASTATATPTATATSTSTSTNATPTATPTP